MCYSNPLPTQINCTVERLRLKVPRLVMLFIGWRLTIFFGVLSGFEVEIWFLSYTLPFWTTVMVYLISSRQWLCCIDTVFLSQLLIQNVQHMVWRILNNSKSAQHFRTTNKALYYGQMPFLEIDMRHPGSWYIVTHHDKLWWVS